MNFREELRKKKYEVDEIVEVEKILKVILDYFQKKRFARGMFTRVRINFTYNYSTRTATILDSYANTDDIIFSSVCTHNGFLLLAEKFHDEGYEMPEYTSFRFSVIIKP